MAKRPAVKFGKSEAVKPEVSVETRSYYGQGPTREAALIDALQSAEEHEAFQTQRIATKDDTIKRLEAKLAFLHQESAA